MRGRPFPRPLSSPLAAFPPLFTRLASRLLLLLLFMELIQERQPSASRPLPPCLPGAAAGCLQEGLCCCSLQLACLSFAAGARQKKESRVFTPRGSPAGKYNLRLLQQQLLQLLLLLMVQWTARRRCEWLHASSAAQLHLRVCGPPPLGDSR
ncbi:hypothetical protein Efla_001031 [Eimeria flavescens]